MTADHEAVGAARDDRFDDAEALQGAAQVRQLFGGHRAGVVLVEDEGGHRDGLGLWVHLVLLIWTGFRTRGTRGRARPLVGSGGADRLARFSGSALWSWHWAYPYGQRPKCRWMS